jgi:hypothetical protein
MPRMGRLVLPSYPTIILCSEVMNDKWCLIAQMNCSSTPILHISILKPRASGLAIGHGHDALFSTYHEYAFIASYAGLQIGNVVEVYSIGPRQLGSQWGGCECSIVCGYWGSSEQLLKEVLSDLPWIYASWVTMASRDLRTLLIDSNQSPASSR